MKCYVAGLARGGGCPGAGKGGWDWHSGGVQMLQGALKAARSKHLTRGTGGPRSRGWPNAKPRELAGVGGAEGGG